MGRAGLFRPQEGPVYPAKPNKAGYFLGKRGFGGGVWPLRFPMTWVDLSLSATEAMCPRCVGLLCYTWRAELLHGSMAKKTTPPKNEHVEPQVVEVWFR